MSANDSTPAPPTSSFSGFTLFVATLALLIAIGAALAVAFRIEDTSNGLTASGTTMMSRSGSGSGATPGSMMGANGSPTGSSTTGGSSEVEEVDLIVKSDEEHAKRGPEGTWHDAFLPAGFTVQPGATVKVTVLNYDEGEHSFTSTQLGTNVTIAAGSPKSPAVTTFTFTAPTKAGSYTWHCALPCDPWAMSHMGYMRGAVTVA